MYVAPAITSTSAEFFSTILAGSSFIALSPIPAVSLAPTASTFVILSPSFVTVTVTSPPNPLPVPVKVSALTSGVAVWLAHPNSDATINKTKINDNAFFIISSKFMYI